MKLIATFSTKYLPFCNRITSCELMIYIHTYVSILFLFYSNISILIYYVYLYLFLERLAGLDLEQIGSLQT